MFKTKNKKLNNKKNQLKIIRKLKINMKIKQKTIMKKKQ
jgi:hypothetical protein